jgi:hypothetical protein
MWRHKAKTHAPLRAHLDSFPVVPAYLILLSHLLQINELQQQPGDVAQTVNHSSNEPMREACAEVVFGPRTSSRTGKPGREKTTMKRGVLFSSVVAFLLVSSFGTPAGT